MRNRIEREFFRCGRAGRALFIDDEIALYPQAYDLCDARMGGAKIYNFDILELKTYSAAGEISLRFGEDRSLYYLGHIGYHIDPAYRGHHWAAKACELVGPFFKAMKMRTFCITTDPDNLPSRKTCERIGGILESVVPVPADVRREFGISAIKCRYICRTDSFTFHEE